MKGTIDLLSAAEREVLAHWYDTPSYVALKKLLRLERENTATKLIDINPADVVSIARHQGRADNCKQLHLTLKKNYKAQVALEKKKPTKKS